MPKLADARNELLSMLATKPIQIALVCTGGGAGAIARCYRRPGASRNFVEAVIPYSRAASAEYLGSEIDVPYASATLAERLAVIAMQRAERLGDASIASNQYVGIALTAALPTDQPATTNHQIHVAVQHADFQACWSNEFVDVGKTRDSAEDIADEMIFRAIAHVISQATIPNDQ